MTLKANTEKKYEIMARSMVSLDGLTFEKWMKSMKVNLNSMKGQWGLEDADLMSRYGIEEGPDADDEIERRFEQNVRSEFDDWMYKYKRFKYPLTLYRAICVPNIKDVNLTKLGTDWSDKLASAECYARDRARKGSKIFVVKAEVKKTDIDWGASMWNNLNEAFGRSEQEINLIPGKKIKILEIQTPQDEWVKIGKPGTV